MSVLKQLLAALQISVVFPLLIRSGKQYHCYFFWIMTWTLIQMFVFQIFTTGKFEERLRGVQEQAMDKICNCFDRFTWWRYTGVLLCLYHASEEADGGRIR